MFSQASAAVCISSHSLLGPFLTLLSDPSGIYGALANLQMIVAAGKLNPSDINDPTGAVQRVIANLAVA